MTFDPIALIVGANIRKQRAILGWTQGKLAREVKTHRPIVGRIESGLHVPEVSTVFTYAKALGVHPGVLLDGVDSAAQTRQWSKA